MGSVGSRSGPNAIRHDPGGRRAGPRTSEPGLGVGGDDQLVLASAALGERLALVLGQLFKWRLERRRNVFAN